MIATLLAAYLLIASPALSMWRSLRAKRDKPSVPLLRRYWSMSWQSLILLGVLCVGAWQAGYMARDIGFDLPLSNAGAWGLGFSVVLLGGLSVAGSIIERRKTPRARAENERKLLDAPMPWPRTMAEAILYATSMMLMTATWEILYRGFLLLVLAPRTGLPIAIAASALAYGIAHGYKTPKQLIGAIVSAFIFTIAYAFTHSLWWLIVIHAGLPLSVLPTVLRARRRREKETALALTPPR